MDLEKFSALAIAENIKNGAITAVDAAKACLDRIEQTDPQIGAWLTVDRGAVLESAQDVQNRIEELLSRGQPLPALAGVPVGIKDNICTEGVKTTCASRILSNFVPPYSATVVKKLEDNLMVPLGKLNMDEFAMGSSTEHSAFQKTYNPWDLGRVPGGSSGGSAAAVASRQAPLALGSDTGGSIRQPSAFCGVTGLKPTYGTVSRYGLVAFGSSLDQIGPIAQSAADCAALFDAIKGHDKNDSTSYDRAYASVLSETDDFRPRTIGIPVQYTGEGIAPEITKAVEDAAAQFGIMGCKIVELSIPELEYSLPAYYIISSAEASSNLSRFDGIRYGYRTEHIDSLDDLYTRTRSEGFGPEVKRRIMLGAYALCAGYYDEYYNKALKARALLKQGFARAFTEADMLLSPTTPTPAFRFGEKADAISMYKADICTVSVNIAGLPALSFPGGFSSDGMPMGLQLVGPEFSEGLLLSCAHAFQKKTDYHLRAPSGRGDQSA